MHYAHAVKRTCAVTHVSCFPSSFEVTSLASVAWREISFASASDVFPWREGGREREGEGGREREGGRGREGGIEGGKERERDREGGRGREEGEERRERQERRREGVM